MKALITGASSGIGRDMAKILAKRGYELILVARDEASLEKLKNELNVETKIVCMDLSAVENCKRLHQENPEVNLLINNAGFGDCGSFEKTSLDKEINMINTNITAYHILTKLYLIDMKNKNEGQILNVASIAGFMPGPLMSTYYATKSYIVKLSEGIREELNKEKSNVKISILCPGPVKTNFNNVANVKFAVREADSYKTAKYALDHLSKFYIVPGFTIKLARFFCNFIPDFLIAKITYKIQKRKIYKESKFQTK